VYRLMLSRASECGIEMRVDLDKTLGDDLMDPEAIHCCLLNLVTNALDACLCLPSGDRPGEVVLSSRRTGNWGVEYQVRDNGCGLDAETQAKVFRAFFSTKGSRGTGLGLMITKKIVREHSGEIELHSKPGEGTVFTVRLPDLPVC
jgi:signal transduction histidine kinase